MPNFTDLKIRTLPEGLHFDERTPGFAIRVGKHRRTWLVVKQPNRTKVRLGHYPDLSLQDARRRALVTLGSPLHPRTSPLFLDALDAFLAQDRWKASTKKMLAWSLRRHFKWRKPLDKITHEDVAQVLDAIEATSERAHAFTNVRIFFNWCIPRYLSVSPTQGYHVEAPTSRERVLTDEELRRVWIAAESCGQFGVIVKLLILTGQRRGEIAALQNGWLQTDTLTIPAGVAKNGRQSVIPLSPLAVVLASNLATGRHLMTPFSAWSKNKKSIDALSHVSNWTLHDLRRTFSSGLAQLGTPLHVTEKILNHLSGSISGVAAVYNRYSFMEEMRAAVTRWEDKVLSLVR